MKRLVKKASEYDGKLERIRENVISELKAKVEDFSIFEITNVDWVRGSELEIEDFFEVKNTEESLDKVKVTYTLDEYERENFEVSWGYDYNEYIDLKDSNSVAAEVVNTILGGYEDEDFEDEDYEDEDEEFYE